MKKILAGMIMSITALSVSAQTTENPSPGTPYHQLLNGSNKEELLKQFINNSDEKKNVLKDKQCEEVTHYSKIRENDYIAFFQVACKNITRDVHLMLFKLDDIEPVLHSCIDVKNRLDPDVQCRKRLRN